MIGINFVVILLYSTSIRYAFGVGSWQSISQFINSTVELIIYNLSILCLIYAENKGLSLILSGTVILLSGDFIINYSYLSQTNIETYGELFWFLGLILITYGTILIKQEAKKGVTISWFRNANTIKSKLAFWSFSISIINIIPFFVLI